MKKMVIIWVSLAVFLVLIMWLWHLSDADAKRREALSRCWEGVADSYCGEASLSDDGKCVRESLPDGAQCRGFQPSFCDLSCVCKGGESQMEKRDCDDGNPCTNELNCGCGNPSGVDGMWVCGGEFFGKCSPYPIEDGTSCGPDLSGQCRRGLCVMLDGTIHVDYLLVPASGGIPKL